MGAVGSKRETSGMFSHAMNYLNTHGGDDSLALNDDIPMENRLFYGGSPASAESLLKELKDYRLSKSARAKETVMKAVIETLGDLGIKSHGNDIDSIIKTIEEKIPNPRKGDSFVDDAKAQADICKKIAAAVNKGMKSVYGDRVGDLIDPKGPPEYVCSSVVDLIHSFSSGIHLEYLSVRESLEKVITELAAAHEVLKKSVEVFMSKLNESNVDFDTGADKFIAIYQKAEQEIALKIQILSGLLKLNVMPSLEELELAMKSESEGRDYVNSIIGIGTQDFGDSIAYAINNMGTVAGLTNIINKSLKKLDMSMDEYLNIDNLKQLDAILNKKLDQIISNNNSDREKKDDLTSILIAVDKLKKYFVSKNKLKKMKGGINENVSGGAITTKYKSADEIRVEKLDKRIKAMQKSQEILYKSFIKELYGAYDELLKVINAFGPKLGTQIKIGPHIDDLIQVFQRLSKSNDLRSSHFELALSGLADNDLSSKETKQLFVQLLRDIIRHCEQANQHNSSDYFETLKQAVKLLIEVIERFNKIAKIKFGGQVEQLQADIAAVGGADSYAITYDPKYVSKDSIKLDEAVGTMIYYYYIANVKSNIKNNAKEVVSYGKSYEKILEEAIRFKREDLMKSKKEIIDKAVSKITDAGKKSAYVDQLEKRFNTYDNLLRVVEAVDLHLKDTTVSLVDNPDLVKGLKKTLDSSRIIAKWFNEEAGSELFKAFLATDGTYAAEADINKITESDEFAQHPYLAFKGTPGIDTLGEAGKDLKFRKVAEESISNSVDNFQALQNIINIFILIGGPTKKSLSARQMFKYLVDYIKISAIHDNIKGTDTLSRFTNVLPEDHLGGGNKNNEVIDTTHGLKKDDDPLTIQKDMDQYFKFIMKSITGKIFVILGLYQLLESPTPMNEISDVRFILGGNYYDSAQIIPEASEFYYRIPRVLEYYRNIFARSYLFNQADIDKKLATYGIAKDKDTRANVIKRIQTERSTIYAKRADIKTEESNISAEETGIKKERRDINTQESDTNSKNDQINTLKSEIAVLQKQINDNNLRIKYIDTNINEISRQLTANGTKYTSSTDSAERANLKVEEADLKQKRNDLNTEKKAKEDEITDMTGNGFQKDINDKRTQITTIDTDITNNNDVAIATATTNIGNHEAAITTAETNITNLRTEIVTARQNVKDLEMILGALGDTVSGSLTEDSSITMLIDPEMKFYELFSLLWDQIPIESVQNGNYSDIECNKLINAINKVYNEYKNKENPIKEVIQEMIWEVNRRYGIISKNEILKFGDLRRYRTNKVDAKNLNINNGIDMIDILPDEEDIELTGVPSDNIIMDVEISKGNVEAVIRQQNKVDLNKYIILDDFRTRVEDTFAGIKDDISDYVKNTFKNTLSHIKSDIAATRSSDEKMRIVKKLITGNHKLANVNQFKFLMFHETVVVGINTLRHLIEFIEQLETTLNIASGTKDYNALSGIISQLFIICGNNSDLIKLSFGNQTNLLQFDFSAFRSEFESILSDVRRYIELFRPYIPEDIINKYERGPPIVGSTLADDNKYTFVHLESLYTELLKPSQFLDEFALLEEKAEFDKTIYHKIKKCNSDLAGFLSTPTNYGEALASIVFYLKDKLKSSTSTPHLAAFGELFSTEVKYVKGTITPTKITGATNYISFYTSDKFNYSGGVLSILGHFNHLVYKLMSTFYDKPLKKFYINLLQPFISGKLSSAVNSSIDSNARNVFPDITGDDAFKSNAADPNNDAILCTTNALVLRNLIYTLTNTGTQAFISQNISEIPVYMRELYKCNLPYFVKSFDDLIKYCEFVRFFIDETRDTFGTKFGRDSTNIGTTTSHTAASGLPGSMCLKSGEKEFAPFISDIKDMLNNFVEAANEIKETCERVYREVADEQIYLQTEPDQYSKFVSKYDRVPIAPISFNLLGLEASNDILNIQRDINSKEFKYNYGVRSTLLDSKDINMSTIPFNKYLVQEFSNIVNNDDKISISTYEEFTKKVIKNFRYIANFMNFRRRFVIETPSYPSLSKVSSGSTSPYACASPVVTTYKGASKLFDLMLTTNVTASLDDFLMNITSGTRRMKFSLLKDHEDADLLNARENERRYNFIDLNVLPINPNALMRDIPLSNVFNYSYTFEKMLKRFLPLTDYSAKLIYDMTIDPYTTNLPGTTTDIAQMFKGANSSVFGRPKFLSDQIFNKVLLGKFSKSGTTAYMPRYLPSAVHDPTKTLDVDTNIITFDIEGVDKDELSVLIYNKDKLEFNTVKFSAQISEIERTRRFNTNIVRNMIFITNLFRIIRHKLESDLVDRKKILQPTHNLVDVSTTEYKLDQFHRDSDYQNDVVKNSSFI